jgi:hypothetical protein
VAYDSAHDQVVLFGGNNSSNAPVAYLWLWH